MNEDNLTASARRLRLFGRTGPYLHERILIYLVISFLDWSGDIDVERLVFYTFRLEHSPKRKEKNLQVQWKRLLAHVFGIVGDFDGNL